MPEPLKPGASVSFEPPGLEALIACLARRDYRVVGPTLRDGAIVYDDINALKDLPAGWSDEQDGGKYRLAKRGDAALFGYAVGPHSWKIFLHPPVLRLWQAGRSGNGFEIQPEPPPPKFAFLGVRSCELHAIAVQDKVFMGGTYVDPDYAQRRQNAFIVAVNCAHAGGTCFCVSMNTGPKATFGFDIALTEILRGGRHDFVAEAGSPLGAEVLAEVSTQLASEEQKRHAAEVVENTAAHMGRTLDTSGIQKLLAGNLEHPRWDEVAARCETCANCTMVCPTCFCSTVEDVTDLTGQHAERWRKWDSCFTLDFSYIHGGSARASAKSRYRQWLTHKLGTWFDQFGTSGCVGCGRCITWCPVAIDLTEEVKAIRATDGAATPPRPEGSQP